MWIVLRVVLAALGFLLRQHARWRGPRLDQAFAGVPYFTRLRRNRRGITGFAIGMARRSPARIQLHVERRIDRWFKWLGVASEVQTGDAAFDRRVYVTCDHPFVAQLLTTSAELRAAIFAVLQAGYARVYFDGATVSIERTGQPGPTEHDLQLLHALWRASRELEGQLPSRARDPFVWKALVIEGVAWSIGGYAIGAWIELTVHRANVHVSPPQLWKLGLAVAAIAFVILVGGASLWIRGSSRGHRVIIECALVLLVGLPVASTQLVADTNRALDDAPSVRMTPTIAYCDGRSTGRYGRFSSSLWLAPDATTTAPTLPREIWVTRALCAAAVPGTTAEIEVAPGRWGIPWYRRIRVGDQTWESPL